MTQMPNPNPAANPNARHVILGAGPVGRAVASNLVRAGVSAPLVVTRSATNVPGATAVGADINDASALTPILGGADIVYQCAQPAYHRWPQEFPTLQSAVVEAAAATGALVVAVENLYGYGPVDGSLTEQLPLAATTRKGAVRAEMWRELLAAHESGRIRAVAARASDFFGPHVEGSAFGDRFVAQVRAGKKVDILGDPDALHTASYIEDLATAMVRLASEPSAWGRAWHIPNAPAVTQRHFVELAATAAGTAPKVRTIHRWQLRALGTFAAPMREMVELAYEFEHDFVVDASDYIAHFGDHSTPLDVAFAATFDFPAIVGAR